jgi:AsmA-like C-terminal region
MSRRLVRWSIVAALGVLVTMAIVAGVGSRTSTLRKLVIDTLAERLDSEVELGSLSVDTIPSVHITGTALVIRHKNRRDVPPLVSVDSFTLDGGLFGLLSRPRRFRVVSVTGLRLNIPPGGINGDRDSASPDSTPATDHPAASKHKGSDDDDPGAIVVDRLVADNAALVLIPRRADKEPKIFDVRRLTMEPLGRGEVMAYHAVLTNPLPKGSIDTTGTFGPWQREDPGRTALTGKYTFDNVDLATVKGIGGHLTSTGTFQGQLDRIAVTGETRTPDFFVKVSGNPVPLDTKFEAVVDGTDGDTYLNDVSASFLKTALTARGAVVGAEGVKGRTVKVHVKIEDGRIEDVLRLAVRGEQPLMRGRLALHADLTLPAGPGDVMDRLGIAGEMDVVAGRFTDGGVQQKISNMSERARGLDPDAHADDVASDLRAKFALSRGVLALRDVSFAIPGATVQVAGTYGLFTEAMAFDGTVRMKATVSEAAGGGVKSILLKVVDPLFRKGGAGAVIPIRVRGTRKVPDVGLDVKKVFKGKG